MAPSNTPASNGFSVKQGFSKHPEAHTAIKELMAQIEQPNTKVTLIFFSDSYSDVVGESLLNLVPGVVVACTTAGQLGSNGYQIGGITGMTLAGNCMEVDQFLIHPLSTLTEQVVNIAEDVHLKLRKAPWRAFGLLVVDGLSMREEILAAALYRALGDIPIVGGSAADMLNFKETRIYHEGKLYKDAAVLTLIQTNRPFITFKHQHYQPTSTRLVITEADPEKRLVSEINGEPAVVAYAKSIGKRVEDLDASVFSRYPLMLKIHDDFYIRSIADIGADGSLKFYCAIAKGLILRIGEGKRAVEAFQQDLQKISEQLGSPPAVIIGCDCILRRLELEEKGLGDDLGSLFSEYQIFGFSTFGEQLNSIHINQTFTGVAIAG